MNAQGVDVLIVGAGPTGLTTALAAVTRGMTVRIIDRLPARAPFSKALLTHERTLAVFDELGVGGEVRSRGMRLRALNLHGTLGARGRIEVSPLVIPQFETECILEAALQREGVCVEWNTALSSLEQAAVSMPSRWIVGADGGRSTVRTSIGATLKREEGATFVLADVHSPAALPEAEAHAFVRPGGFVMIIPTAIEGPWRIVAHVPSDNNMSSTTRISTGLIDEIVFERTGIHLRSHTLEWSSRFVLSHGVTTAMRRGNVLLAGDAAHIHSPIGGQGLNTGVQDAHALVRHLASGDPTAYEAERMHVAHRVVARVRRATHILTQGGRTRRFVIGAVAPRILPRAPLRRRLVRAIAGEPQPAGQ